MRLSKVQRAELREKFGGRCAYCGDPLGEKWHADHFDAVHRAATIRGGKYVQTGEVLHPERDAIENMMPACPPCNIDKSVYTVDQWRAKLQRSVEMLERYESTFRHARRFGLVKEVKRPVVFYFEKLKTS